MGELDFERARQPEQKAQRRNAVIAAARRLVDLHGVRGTTLSGIAREVGLAKSNLYRYFDGYEAILIEVLLDELDAFTEALGEALGPLEGSGEIDAVVDAIVSCFLARPRLGQIGVALSTVLEHDMGEETVASLLRRRRARMEVLAQQVAPALPALTQEQIQRFFDHFWRHAVGGQPSAHPCDAARKVLKRPEFAYVSLDVATGLRDHARLLLRGLSSEKSEAADRRPPAAP